MYLLLVFLCRYKENIGISLIFGQKWVTKILVVYTKKANKSTVEVLRISKS